MELFGLLEQVARNDWIVRVREDAFERAIGGCFERVVYLFGGSRVFLEDSDEIHHRNVGSRYAHGVAVELAVKFGNHQADGFRGASRRWNQVQRSSTGAAQILVRKIKDALVVGVAVYGRHRTFLDAERIVQNFDERRQTIGGAGSVRQNVVLGGVVLVVVHTQHDGDVFALSRGRDDDFFDGAAKVLFGVGGIGKPSGRFDDDLCAQAGPINFGRVFNRKNLDLLVADANAIAFGLNVFVELPKYGVILQQMGERPGVREVVRGYKFNLGVMQARADNISPDTAKAVDTYLNWHMFLFYGARKYTPEKRVFYIGSG